jgi:hypothetical protein
MSSTAAYRSPPSRVRARLYYYRGHTLCRRHQKQTTKNTELIMKKNLNPTSPLLKASKLAKHLERDVRSIALENGRRVGTEGHAIVERYLEQRLEQIGCVPYSGDSFRISYEDEGIDFTNIVGVIPGKDRSLQPLLIGAHYDSVIDAPCADDNAAAVAIALAVGEMAAELGNLERDLVIAIFDAEEPPHFQTYSMGSNRFYEDQMKPEGVHAALVMDLVGHDISIPGELLGNIPRVGSALSKIPGIESKDINVPFLSNLLFITGTESNAGLIGIVGEHHSPKGLKVLPTLNDYVGDMSDHGVFRENGVPYLFLSCGRWAHYHMPSDTPDRLNYKKMAAITHYTCDLLAGMDAKEMKRGSFEQFHETLDLEASQLKKVLGPAHNLVLKKMGINSISTRSDMTRFACNLLNTGL